MRENRLRSSIRFGLVAWWIVLVRLAWPDGSGAGLGDRIFDKLDLGARLGPLGQDLFSQSYMRASIVTLLVIGAMPLAAGLVALLRMVARADVRASKADPLARLRDAVARRPRAAALASAVPGLLAALATFLVYPVAASDGAAALLIAVSGGAALAAGAMSAVVARGLLHLLVAPLETAAPGDEGTQAEGHTFAAVAVTREARAAVGVLAAISLAVVGAVVALPLSALDSAAYWAALLGYVALAGASAVAYRRVSRVALGLDGVRVEGSSRRRFFAYRDLDEVVSLGGEILLRREDRTVLRLQLHGRDAERREAIALRLEACIARARAPGAAHRLARGETDYRRAGASREELWEVLEAPAAEPAARARAAAALAVGSGDDDRRRLRVAAAHCAEPATRVALLRIAEVEFEEAEAAGAVLLPAKRMSYPGP